jgi:hypothetical protein
MAQYSWVVVRVVRVVVVAVGVVVGVVVGCWCWLLVSAGNIFSHVLSHVSLGVLAVSFTQTIKVCWQQQSHANRVIVTDRDASRSLFTSQPLV